jgi:hypothetical protein
MGVFMNRDKAATELAEQFLNAYDADDDGASLNALRSQYCKAGEASVLAGMLKHFAAIH